MFALGHMMLGYLTVRALDRVFKTRTRTWIALTVGMIPDVDLFFAPWGMVHHTYTHSILFWLPLAPLVFISPPFVPVYFGIVQHMLDDALVGTVPILLPVSSIQVGINSGIPSATDTLLEGGAFVAAALVAYGNGDVTQLLSVRLDSFWSIIPLATLSSMTFIASREFKTTLINYAFSSKNLTLISLGHILIAGFLFISSVQGVRALLKQRSHETVSLS